MRQVYPVEGVKINVNLEAHSVFQALNLKAGAFTCRAGSFWLALKEGSSDLSDKHVKGYKQPCDKIQEEFRTGFDKNLNKSATI